MNWSRGRRDGGSNVRRRTETLFQRQPCADYRSGRGADDKICNPKIDSLTSETIHQPKFPSSTYRTAATEHECPRSVTSSPVRAAVRYYFHGSVIASKGLGGPVYLDDPRHGQGMAAWGHEDLFPPTRLGARDEFGERTFARTLGNWRNAPKAAIYIPDRRTGGVDPKAVVEPSQ